MSTKKLIKALGLIIVVALMAAALPLQAKAQTEPQTLNVAQWTGPTNTGITGRETVLFDGTYYHMWYSSSDETKLYHTSSADPASFTAATDPCTFTDANAPVEVGSVSVVKEGSTFYMIAYEKFGSTDALKKFAIYTSGNGDYWTYGGVVFAGAGLPPYNKIDGAFLFKDGDKYRLYFQVKNEAGTRYDIYTAESTAESLAAIAATGDTVDFMLANNNAAVLSPGGTGAWDSGSVMQPWVVKEGNVYYMWYVAHTGSRPQLFGFAYSSDGYEWTKSGGNPIIDNEAIGYAEPSVIVNADGTWQMWTMGTGGVINYLTATGPFEFQTIQAAIDEAANGDVITVGPGTYYGAITINKEVKLQSTAGPATTIIHGGLTVNDTMYTVVIRSSNVTFEGFTVTSPNYNPAAPWNLVDPIGISIGYYGDNSLSNIVINNNYVTQIGSADRLVTADGYPSVGIVVNGVVAGLDITNNKVYDIHQTVTDPAVTWGPTGIGFYGYDTTPLSSDVVISGNEVYNISANAQAPATTISNGIRAGWGSGDVTISGNNVHDIDGRAIAVTSANNGVATITNNTISHADTGIYLYNARGGVLSGNTFTNVTVEVDQLPVHNVTKGLWYATIQAAIDAQTTVAGDVIEVGPGTYTENVNINKGVTLRASGSSVSIVGQATVNASNVTFNGFKLSNPNANYGLVVNPGVSNVTITGNTFENIGGTAFAGYVKGIYLLSGPDNVTIEGNIFRNIHANTQSVNAVYSGDSNAADPATGLVIRNNVFENLTSATKGGYGILLNNGAGNPGVVIEGNTFDGISGGWTHAIGLEGPTPNALVNRNTFRRLTAPGVDKAAVFFEDNPGLATTSITNNQFLNAGFGVAVHPDMGTHATVLATPNWWGQASGPAAGQLPTTGDYDYSPWCAAADCLTFLPDEDGVVPLSGTINVPGGIFIGTPGLTYHLAADTVIQNDSPCFVITASNTIIDAEPGAKCIPTGSSNGIDVAANLFGIVIEGLEIDGSEQTPTADVYPDGIHFAGPITNFQIVNNYIHNLGGNAIEFVGTPSGTTMDIQGNLFETSTLGTPVIVVPTGLSPALNAQYNNWDAMTSPTIANVDTSNNTYASLRLTSMNTPWPNQVAVDEIIKYNVVADLQNVTGAAFTLSYPTNLTLVATDPITLPGVFTNESVNISTTGKLVYIGYNQASEGNPVGVESGSGIVLFTASFTATSTGSGALTFSEDGFSMMPPSGPSNLVYTNAMTDGSVKVIDLPSLVWIDGAGPYSVGYAHDFTLTVNNPLTGGTFTATEIAFTLPTGATLKSWDGDSYEPLTGNFTIGPLAPDGSDNVYKFQITFDSEGTKPLTVRLVDTTPETDFNLATIEEEITVGGTYSVFGEISMQGRTFRGNVPVLLTKLDVPVYGPFPGTTVAQLGTNLTISNLPSGSYEFTTSQARYLNITADLDKQFTLGTANHILPALMLRGGNVVDTGEGVIPNKVDLSDAGLIGGAYGTSGNPLEIPADANFDGRVNILDLALVGGNYELTSADYDWSPVTLP